MRDCAVNLYIHDKCELHRQGNFPVLKNCLPQECTTAVRKIATGGARERWLKILLIKPPSAFLAKEGDDLRFVWRALAGEGGRDESCWHFCLEGGVPVCGGVRAEATASSPPGGRERSRELTPRGGEGGS